MSRLSKLGNVAADPLRMTSSRSPPHHTLELPLSHQPHLHHGGSGQLAIGVKKKPRRLSPRSLSPSRQHLSPAAGGSTIATPLAQPTVAEDAMAGTLVVVPSTGPCHSALPNQRPQEATARDADIRQRAERFRVRASRSVAARSTLCREDHLPTRGVALEGVLTQRLAGRLRNREQLTAVDRSLAEVIARVEDKPRHQRQLQRTVYGGSRTIAGLRSVVDEGAIAATPMLDGVTASGLPRSVLRDQRHHGPGAQLFDRTVPPGHRSRSFEPTGLPLRRWGSDSLFSPSEEEQLSAIFTSKSKRNKKMASP